MTLEILRHLIKRLFNSGLYLPFFLVCGVTASFRAPAQQFSTAIEDNSFFIEEAFNQESGVIQHISTACYRPAQNVIQCSFTEEWPLRGQRHQLSVTIPYTFTDMATEGFGDIALNYRFQLLDENDWCWATPRISLLFPTGRAAAGLGAGTLGIQTNFCASKRWSDQFITHLNAGMTVVPEARSTDPSGRVVHRTLSTINAGASLIWLCMEQLNLLCEVLFTNSSALDLSGNIVRTSESIFNPGVRYAANLGTLQIVPGASLPLFISRNLTTAGVFFYLSFEHPI
jgi:hypothetical protein